jgi:mannose-6-phosphate isomerase-like protein (cupin superfamily)
VGPGSAYITSAHAVEARREPGDTAETRTTIDGTSGCELLEQRVMRFGRGRSAARRNPGRQEVLFVAAGRGTLRLDGEEHELEPDVGVFIVPGEEYEIENGGDDDLLIVSVTAPLGDAGVGSDRRVTVRYADQPPLPASPNREFRYLVNEDAGCLDVTQFVGLIPPGKAPDHSHTYDEVIYVIEGEGIFHVDGTESPMGPGTCIHLPPLVPHCLENRGERDLRVLGVFHPSGDPASRAGGANNGEPPTSKQTPTGKEGE